jgi:DNA-directed RNA polymerase subunit RPC12/RpoP
MYITCNKCKGRVFVDRVFLSNDHLELFCLNCGKRDMFHFPEKFGKFVQWIMQVEKERAKKNASKI